MSQHLLQKHSYALVSRWLFANTNEKHDKIIGRSSKGNVESEANGVSSKSKDKNDWGEEGGEEGE